MYLIYSESSSGSPSAEREADRLAYIRWLEHEGRLYGFGRLESQPGNEDLELAIVAAVSREEAERIAHSDPYHKGGLRQNRVQPHTINEGVACYVARAMSKRAMAASAPFEVEPHDLAAGQETNVAGAATSLYLLRLTPTNKPRAAADVKTMDAHFVWLRENEMSARAPDSSAAAR
jgi:uncharacterized protein YciI